MNEYQKIRLEKRSQWAERQLAYPGKFDKTHQCAELKVLPDHPEQNYRTAGRIISQRVMGKLTFMQLQDQSGRLQISLQQDILGAEDYKFFTKKLDVGDHIGISGVLYTTQKLEKTLQVQGLQLLSKGLLPLPEKFHGLTDPELKARYRFLDLMLNQETQKKFWVRHQMMKFLRSFLDRHQFVEVDTPTLQAQASGASARPFKTHHHALDIELYLRIAPETYLKRLIAGGYDRVYELGKCFRNEGIDASHLQEFTMLEWYCAYWDFKDNLVFVKEMIQELLQSVLGTQTLTYEGTELDFSGEWPSITFRDLVKKYTEIDLHEANSFEALKAAITAKKLELDLDKYVGLGALIDGLYKKYCRPHLIQPIFITHQHRELVPLARVSDAHPEELDMFQLVVNGWEVVKAYSELVDPIEQRQRLTDQAALKDLGDDEAMVMEEDFILAMEYGMPPMSGLGFGFERFLALMTNSSNIRDIIYFPSLRPPQALKEEELEDLAKPRGEGEI